MPDPDYVICQNCDTPSYTFEWEDGELTEAQCEACGNDDPEKFGFPEGFDVEKKR